MNSGDIYYAGDDANTDDASVSFKSFTMRRAGYDPLSYFTDTLDNDDSFSIVYPMLRQHVGVLEPHADNYLYSPSFTSSSSYLKFSLCKTNSSDDCSWGSSVYSSAGDDAASTGVADDNNTQTVPVNPSCVPGGIFLLTVWKLSLDVQSPSSSDVSVFNGTVLCTYVRREMRDLIDEDLGKVMDAMYELWTVGDDDGAEQYGDDFHSITYCK